MAVSASTTLDSVFRRIQTALLDLSRYVTVGFEYKVRGEVSPEELRGLLIDAAVLEALRELVLTSPYWREISTMSLPSPAELSVSISPQESIIELRHIPFVLRYRRIPTNVLLGLYLHIPPSMTMFNEDLRQALRRLIRELFREHSQSVAETAESLFSRYVSFGVPVEFALKEVKLNILPGFAGIGGWKIRLPKHVFLSTPDVSPEAAARASAVLFGEVLPALSIGGRDVYRSTYPAFVKLLNALARATARAI